MKKRLKMSEVPEIIQQLKAGDKKALSRCISLVENDSDGADEILKSLNESEKTRIVGITGPPGAGKSTLINSIIKHLVEANKKVGVICIDPTSPFNYGSLLADRLRMGEHFNQENVFIRSLATRGSLGGLSAKAIEITDVMKSFGFDYVFVETVGVGQSEVEIAGLADTTVLVLVPEAGDDIQTIKSGIMEIADIFVVNKADREGSDIFAKNLHHFLHSQEVSEWVIPVISSVATQGDGVEEIIAKIDEHQNIASGEKKYNLLTEKAYQLIQQSRMNDIDKKELQQKLIDAFKGKNFNLYAFIEKLQL